MHEALGEILNLGRLGRRYAEIAEYEIQQGRSLTPTEDELSLWIGNNRVAAMRGYEARTGKTIEMAYGALHQFALDMKSKEMVAVNKETE